MSDFFKNTETGSSSLILHINQEWVAPGSRGGEVARESDFLSQTMAVTLLNSDSPVPSHSKPSASGRSPSLPLLPTGAERLARAKRGDKLGTREKIKTKSCSNETLGTLTSL